MSFFFRKQYKITFYSPGKHNNSSITLFILITRTYLMSCGINVLQINTFKTSCKSNKFASKFYDSSS